MRVFVTGGGFGSRATAGDARLFRHKRPEVAAPAKPWANLIDVDTRESGSIQLDAEPGSSRFTYSSISIASMLLSLERFVLP